MSLILYQRIYPCRVHNKLTIHQAQEAKNPGDILSYIQSHIRFFDLIDSASDALFVLQ